MNSCLPDDSKDWISVAREAITTEIEGLEELSRNLGPTLSQAIEMLAACTGRVIVSGLGKSGLVGRKIAATFSSTGTPAFFLHPVEGQHGDLGSVRRDDVLIAISNSGKTDELNAIIPALRALGIPVIALTGNMESPLARLADISLNTHVPREACPMNLAPTTSTTATLALGDALAVCLICRKAFTPDDFKLVHPGGALGQRLRYKITELMHTRNVPLIQESAKTADAVRKVDDCGLGAVLLQNDSGTVCGILTDGDVRRALNNGSYSPESPVSAIMTRSFRFATPSQNVADVLDIMEENAILVMPVLTEDKKPLGMVHLHDLLGKGSIKFGK